MTESSAGLESSEPTVSPSRSEPLAPKRHGGRWLLWLVVLGALAAGGYWFWLQQRESRALENMQVAPDLPPPWHADLAGVQARSDDLSTELAQMRERHRALEQRLSGLVAANSALREELFGMAERATLLEQALTRQAQARMEGAQALRLDEVDFLLQMAAERIQLFGDVGAAIGTLQLAQESLEQIREPLFAGVRQTLAQELALLQAQPAAPRSALRAELHSIQRALPQLSIDADEDATAAEPSSRLQELLGSLVSVRRIDDADTMLTPLGRATRLSALRLQLGLALAALESEDTASWAETLAQSLMLFDSLFDPSSTAHAQVRPRLQALQAASPTLAPPSLGAALQELRSLRVTRQLGRAPTRQTAPPHNTAPAPEATGAQPPTPALEIERE